MTSIQHQNIHNVEVLEDNDYFYLMSKQDLQAEPLSKVVFQNSEGAVWFEKLFECYLQICDALKYLHAQNIYHGNISLQNILIESHTYKVFLLDFGSAYYYALLDSNIQNIQQNYFSSPEQSRNKPSINKTQNAQSISTKTDIFSFGLCMLKMLTDAYDESIFGEYKDYQDIDKVFEKIYEYELKDIEKELYPVIKTMLNIEPKERPEIGVVYEKLITIYHKVRKSYQYEINILNKEAKKYCEDNDISTIQFKNHFQEKLKNSYPYIALGKNKEDKDILKIAFIDIAFLCDSRDENDDDRHLFCFKISTSPKDIEDTKKNGILLYDTFVITTNSPEKKYDDISSLKQEIKEKFSEQQKAKEKLAQDRKAIDTEEKYLNAVEKWLENEKNTKKVQLKEQNKGSETLTFEIIYEAKDIFALKNDSPESKEALAQKIFEDGLSDDPNRDVLETLQNIYEKDIFTKQSKAICQKIQERNDKVPQNLEQQLNEKPKKLRYQLLLYGLYKDFFQPPKKSAEVQQKDFKKGDEVVFDIKESNPEYNGTISKVDAIKNTISVKIKKEIIRQSFDKNPPYFISRDVAIEEGILKKEQGALNALKNTQTACPRLLTKINQPSLLQDTELFPITEWFNENLDENQKLAVRKALSLETGADILLIQGPPGTGKTTTITEIVQQYLKENKHAKILVASQSNQAVDNVLEKICEEVKVVRIGKVEEDRETKLSQVAQNYTEARVLDTLIKDTIKRIQDNPTDKPEFKQIQKGFLESLQTLSQQTAATKSKDEKTIDSELADIFLKDIRVLFGTLIGISSYRDFKNMEFELVVVDEAGRAFLSEMLVPLIKAKKIILVGDHKQLAPIVKDEVEPFLYQSGINKSKATESFFGRFYEKIKEAKKENLYHFLNTNYRSHRNICRLYSEAFYKNDLETPDFLERNHNLEFYPSNVILLSTSKLKNQQARQENNEYGWHNPKHIEIIQKELEKIFQELDKKNLSKSIGIISPYRLQVRKLRESLKGFKDRVDIGTVDSFQGSDRDIIIYDSVRSGKRGENISFISDEKRLNVSLSRAKELLIIVGDAEFLYNAKTEGDNPLKKILETIYDEYKESIIECKE